MKSINYLIKPASSACNLRCKYCFYEDIADNRSVKNLGVMSEETTTVLLDKTFEETEEGDVVSFAFQGGEPTAAGLSYFKTFTSLAEEKCPKGVHLSYAIQTNGTMLDENWCTLLKKYDFLVGLSLDGMRSIHDKYRLDANGNKTWTKVCKAKRLLDSFDIPVNALCVVTSDCAEVAEDVYFSLKRLGFRHMQFIACLDPIEYERGSMPFSLKPEAYGRFLCKMFDLWYDGWKNRDYVSIRLFEDYVNLMLGDTSVTCSTCGRCGSYYVAEGDGSIYPCDFFVFDEWKMGYIKDTSLHELYESDTNKRFLDFGKEKPAECSSCTWRSLCNGGCKNDWYEKDQTSHNYFCPSFKMFFEHSYEKLREIANAEGAARMG